MRQVLIYAGEDDYWIAECPSLPGCISQGKDRAEALENIREAIRGWLHVAREKGLRIPAEPVQECFVNVPASAL